MTDAEAKANVERLKRLLDLAAQAKREGRGNDFVRHLQEAMSVAEPLVQGILGTDSKTGETNK